MAIADPLSGVYLIDEGETYEVVAEIEAIDLVEHLPMSPKRLEDIKKAAAPGTNWNEESPWRDSPCLKVMFLKYNHTSTTEIEVSISILSWYLIAY